MPPPPPPPDGMALTDLSIGLAGKGGADDVPPPGFSCLLLNATLGPFFEPDLPFPFFEE